VATEYREQLLPLHGPRLLPGGGVQFRLWAPAHSQILLVVDERSLPMQTAAGGWHSLDVPGAKHGTRYYFQLPDGTKVPDPASHFQPEDVHGPSEIIDPAVHRWDDEKWAGRPWNEAILYELHVGAFTNEGTFRAVIDHLDHLVKLGVTALQIMPIADFPGGRNWGYDGVLPYAPDSSYGRPEDFRALIEAAHKRRLMVLLDVVYNHFGPDGNFLPTYAPHFFTDRHQTPWGAAINYDGEHSKVVREFVIENALYWIREFNLDGLRFDAVHAIMDDSPAHLLNELAERVRGLVNRPVHLILENEENQASRLTRGADDLPQTYTAQWNDDVHHVLHVAATGEDKGYYAEYLGETEMLGRALAEGFAFQGQMMDFSGRRRGEPSPGLPPVAFVAFIQNHDQVGNRAFGDRIAAIAPPAATRAISAIYLLLPQVPMLFMGEEWAASEPFPFFCDFAGELAAAVREGRRNEFAKFPEFQDEKMRERIPDPQAPETFAAAKLGWDDITKGTHAETFAWYQRILAVRKDKVIPLIPRIGGFAGKLAVIGENSVYVTWRLSDRAEVFVLEANLSERSVAGFPTATGSAIWTEGKVAGTELSPWTVRWSIVTSQ
jgi:malto-oligosyltrehalose trehalohydrolase